MDKDTKLNLIVQASWEAQGVKDAQADLGKLAQIAEQTGLAGAAMGVQVQGGLDTVADSSGRTAVRMAALEAKSKETAASLRKLGQDVAAGNKTLDEAEAEYQAAEAALEQYRQELGLAEQQARETNDALKEGDDAGKKSQSNWLELTAKIHLAQQAYQTIARFARMAYDALKEGAALELSARQFDNLTKSIGSTSEAMLSGLSTATKGLVSDADLIAGASQIISLGLAKNEEGVIRLTTVISTLGLDMQQVILTFANNSKARLDALGLSIEDVEAKAAALEDSGFKGDAFDEAVLTALEEKVRLLGDTSETSAGKIMHFEASVKNVTDAGKLWLVGALTPTIDALTILIDVGTKADDVIGQIVDTQIAEAESVGDLIALYERLAAQRGLATTITGTNSDIERNMLKTREAILATSGSADEYAAAIVAMGIPGIEASQITDEVAEALRQSAIAEYEAAMAAETNRLVIEKQTAARERAQSTITAYYVGMGRLSGETEESTWTTYDWNTAVSQQQAQAWAAAEAMKRKAEQMAADAEVSRQAAEDARAYNEQLREMALAADAASGDRFTAALNAGADALVRWQTVTVKTGGLYEDEQANLDELVRAYDRHVERIQSLEGGVAGLGMSTDELNEALGKEYEAMGLIEERMNPLLAVTEEYHAVSSGWAYNQQAINSALYAAADAAGADATQLAMLGLATGQLSEAQAVAALKAAALQGKIEELGAAIANGMDPTEALNRLDAFQSGLEAHDFTVQLGIEVEEGADTKARDKISGLIAKGIPEDDRKVEMVVDTEEAGLSIAGFIEDVVSPVVDDLYEIVMQAETSGATTNVNTLKDLIEQLKDKTITITTVHRDEYANAGSSPDTPGSDGTPAPYATGGRVTGGIPGIDSVPALLTPGEIVVPRQATRSMSDAMAFVSRFVGGGDTAPGQTQTSYVRHGDTYNIETNDRADEAVENLQRWQRQRELAEVGGF